MKTDMNKIPIGMANSEWLVRTVLAALREGQIADAVNLFGDEFAFNDYGIGLEFRDKGRLTEFFRKTRELYPYSLLLMGAILVSGDHVISKWTQQYTATAALIAAGPLKCRSPCTGHLSCRSRTGKSRDGRTTMTD
jgi:hypothetical protein